MTIMETTTAEALDVQTSGARAVDEPRLTLSQVQQLLREAAAYERAQRPIVLHGPEQPATRPQTAPEAHAGIDVAVPGAVAPVALRRTPLRRWFSRGEASYIACTAVFGGGIFTGIGVILFGPVALVVPVVGLGGCLVAAWVMNREDDEPLGEKWGSMREWQAAVDAGTAPRRSKIPTRRQVPELTEQARTQAAR